MERIDIPPAKRFTIPQVAELFSNFGVTREYLGEYLISGKLHAICFPYEEDLPDSIEIAPEDWRARYREPYEFSLYEDWFGDEDLSELGRTDPLHMLPDSTSEGPSRATSAVVYIERAELGRFVSEELEPANGEPAHKGDIRKCDVASTPAIPVRISAGLRSRIRCGPAKPEHKLKAGERLKSIPMPPSAAPRRFGPDTNNC